MAVVMKGILLGMVRCAVDGPENGLRLIKLAAYFEFERADYFYKPPCCNTNPGLIQDFVPNGIETLEKGCSQLFGTLMLLPLLRDLQRLEISGP